MSKPLRKGIVVFKSGNKPLCAPTTWLKHFAKGQKTGGANVPCGTCNACCRSRSTHADLTPEEASRFEHVLVDLGERRQVPALPKKDDGSCVHLVEGRCSIYERRPASCRNYDCRIYAFVGVQPPDDAIMQEAIQQWSAPHLPLVADRELLVAFRVAVAEIIAGGPATDTHYVACAAVASHWKFLAKARKARQEFDAMPLEERNRLEAQFVSALSRLYDSGTDIEGCAP